MDPYGSSFIEEAMMVAAPALVFSVFIFFAMFFALLLAGRRLMPPRTKPGSGGPSAALGIVQERYARGELSRREFEQMRSVLGG